MCKMTMKERMLAVLKGEPVDHSPFVTYNHNAAPNEEIWAALGRNHMGVYRGTYIHKTENDECKLVTEDIVRNGREGLRKSIITPKGTLFEEHLKQYDLNTYAMTKHYVETREDLEILLYYFRTCRCVPYHQYFYNNLEEVGDDGIVSVSVERTPFQQMWILWASMIDLSYLILDCEDLVEECMSEISRMLGEQFEIMAKAVKELPIPLVEFPENMTAPCIGEERFEKYCIPYYRRLKEMIGDTMLGIHADGDVKILAPQIARSGLDFLESFSPPPDNDMPLSEAVKVWPNMSFFINFPSSVHLDTPEKIYETAMEIMKVCQGRKMWIQASESVPPGVWKKSYPEIIRAVEQFR